MSHLGTLLIKLTALLALIVPGLLAQNVPMSIKASHPEAKFWVDGTMYKGSHEFNWPIKSKHILEVRERDQYFSGWQDTRLSFNDFGWSDSSNYTIIGRDSTLTIEADPKIPEYLANFGVEHKLIVWMNDVQIPWGIDEQNRKMVENAEEPLPPSVYGLITVEGVTDWPGCILNSQYAWVREGTEISLNVVPYPNYAFEKWRELDQPEMRFPFVKVTMTGPRTLRAYLAPARRHTFETSPIRGLQVIVDGAEQATRNEAGICLPPTKNPLPTPEVILPGADEAFCPDVPPLCTGDKDLIPGSEHILTAVQVQRAPDGIRWVFDHWDWGGQEKPGLNFKYVVPQEPDPRTMKAVFVRGADATILTVPNGLKVAIDGRSDWNAYNFVWGVGQTHVVAAPAEQTDVQGRRWVFKSWSNGGGATQEVGTTDEHLGYGLVLRAQYELLGQVTVTSDTASPTFVIGDRECRAPCTLDMPVGAEVLVKVQPEEVFGEDIKVKFLGWLDGDMSTQRTFQFTEGANVLTAKFVVLNRLRLISDPEDGVDYSLSPEPTEGMWFPLGQEVALAVEPRRGFRFRRWDGALAGTVPVGRIQMNTPLTVVARMDKIPALKDGAVRNAADLLPSEAVAPGSVIAIDGVNMAAYFEESPKFPLKQAIQGIYVQAGDRLLPLLSVSPDMILALLPSDMKLGEATLVVKTPNEPDLTATFQVARNAPGLFWKAEGELFYAEAYHEDGKLVTPKNPARRGEVIRIAGTGFGPLSPLPPDGFPIPADPAYKLNDPVELQLEDQLYPVDSVTAAPGTHGMVWVRVRITDDMPSAMLARMTVRANGVESSLSALPLQ